MNAINTFSTKEPAISGGDDFAGSFLLLSVSYSLLSFEHNEDEAQPNYIPNNALVL